MGHGTGGAWGCAPGPVGVRWCSSLPCLCLCSGRGPLPPMCLTSDAKPRCPCPSATLGVSRSAVSALPSSAPRAGPVRNTRTPPSASLPSCRPLSPPPPRPTVVLRLVRGPASAVLFAPPPCVTFRLVVAPLRGPGRSPILPFACCVGLLLSVGRCGRCSCWCRFRVRGAQ